MNKSDMGPAPEDDGGDRPAVRPVNRRARTVTPRQPRTERHLPGIAVSAGVAIGPVFGAAEAAPRWCARRSPPPTSPPRARAWMPRLSSRASNW